MPDRFWQDVPISIDLTVLIGASVLYLQGEEGADLSKLTRFIQADTVNIDVIQHLIYIPSSVLGTDTLAGAQCWNHHLSNRCGLLHLGKLELT